MEYKIILPNAKFEAINWSYIANALYTKLEASKLCVEIIGGFGKKIFRVSHQKAKFIT